MTPDELLGKLNELPSEIAEKLGAEGYGTIRFDYVFSQVEKATKKLQIKVGEDTLYETSKKVIEATKPLIKKKWEAHLEVSVREAKERTKALEVKTKELAERGIQPWHLEGVDLNDVSNKFKTLGEVKLAKACGFFVDTDEGSKVNLDAYKAALNESKDKEGAPGAIYYEHNGRLVLEEDSHCGTAYIPKRCVLADPDF